MGRIIKAACVQLNSTPYIDENLQATEKLIREAAAEGGELIATPENTGQLRADPDYLLQNAVAEENHPGPNFFSALARELSVKLLIGSLAIKISEDKVANRSYLFSETGDRLAAYDKIHMFDVDLPDGQKYEESRRCEPGEEAVVVDLGEEKLGLSICYDLRFSYLYRALAQNGAQLIAIPSAFTVPTGSAHWEVLLRARAIETGSYILAPAQCGVHDGGRKTYGHSMIVGPWGEVIAQKEDGVGIIMAELDMGQVDKVRRAIPSLTHDREFTVKAAGAE